MSNNNNKPDGEIEVNGVKYYIFLRTGTNLGYDNNGSQATLTAPTNQYNNDNNNEENALAVFNELENENENEESKPAKPTTANSPWSPRKGARVSVSKPPAKAPQLMGGKHSMKVKKEKKAKGTRKLSPYMKFAQEARKKIISEEPALKSDIIKVGKRIGEMWRGLSAEEKAKY